MTRRHDAGDVQCSPPVLAAAAMALVVAGTVWLTHWPRSTAHAQSAPQSAVASGQPPAATCTARPGQLGVARVVEIDAARGPRFGQQYNDHDFLRENEVVLTFDDGPVRRHTRMVLDALAGHCTQATFFMVGQMAVTDPELVREVARGGHTVAVHTWSHRNLRAIGATGAEQEIELGVSAVRRALGSPVAPFFRFPYLADSPAMLKHLAERNFAAFSIDVDSRDFRTHDPKAMQRNVIQGLAPKHKGIVLMHDIQTSTANGLRGLLDELASKGYRVVHMVPKASAVTQPSADALAETEFVRRHKIAAANPLAQRSVVWPMPAPGVPVEQYQPASGAAPAGPTHGPLRAPARPGVTPAAATTLQPAVVPPAAPQPPPQTAPALEERPAMRGTAEDDDWRRKVFQP